MFSLEFYMFFSFQLFLIGVFGILSTQNNVLFMLMAVEIILLSSNLNYVLISMFFNDVTGQLFAIFILTIAAAESAVGLALLILFYKLRGTVAYPFINLIKG